MIAYVFGGTASGKSAIAERITACSREPRTYIATMQAYDDDARRRVERHRIQRAALNARTIECADFDLARRIDADDAVLLDCTANLVANVLWGSVGDDGRLNEPIPDHAGRTGTATGISRIVNRSFDDLIAAARDVVVVGNDVFCNSGRLSDEMNVYLDVLDSVHLHLIERADLVVEAVCGLPLVHRGELPYGRGIE